MKKIALFAFALLAIVTLGAQSAMAYEVKDADISFMQGEWKLDGVTVTSPKGDVTVFFHDYTHNYSGCKTEDYILGIEHASSGVVDNRGYYGTTEKCQYFPVMTEIVRAAPTNLIIEEMVMMSPKGEARVIFPNGRCGWQGYQYVMSMVSMGKFSTTQPNNNILSCEFIVQPI
jgi:hypothetical protein